METFAKKIIIKFKISFCILTIILVLFAMFFDHLFIRKLHLQFDSDSVTSEVSLITEYRHLSNNGIDLKKFKEKVKVFSPEINNNFFRSFYCGLLVKELGIKNNKKSNNDTNHFSDFDINHIGSQIEKFKELDSTNAFPYILSASFYLLIKDYEKAKTDLMILNNLDLLNQYTFQQNIEVVNYLVKTLRTSDDDLRVYTLAQNNNFFPIVILINLLKLKQIDETLRKEGININQIKNHIGQLLIKEPKYFNDLDQGINFLSNSELKSSLKSNRDSLSQKFDESHGKIYWFFYKPYYIKSYVKIGEIETMKQFSK